MQRGYGDTRGYQTIAKTNLPTIAFFRIAPRTTEHFQQTVGRRRQQKQSRRQYPTGAVKIQRRETQRTIETDPHPVSL